jgi:hypothetical protein
MSILPTPINNDPNDWSAQQAGTGTFQYSTPAEVLVVDIPCACGTAIHVQVNFGLGRPTRRTMPCPGCGKEYVIQAPRVEKGEV